MTKIGVAFPDALVYSDKQHTADSFLLTLATRFQVYASALYADNKNIPDARIMRVALLVEELGELCEALCNKNELDILDALADLDYITHGTAVQFDLPLDEAFWEVHRSNMTKGEGARKDGTDENNGKGADYSSPALLPILLKRRSKYHD